MYFTTTVLRLISQFLLFKDNFACLEVAEQSPHSSTFSSLEGPEHMYFIASPCLSCQWATDDQRVRVRPAALAVH